MAALEMRVCREEGELMNAAAPDGGGVPDFEEPEIAEPVPAVPGLGWEADA